MENVRAGIDLPCVSFYICFTFFHKLNFRKPSTGANGYNLALRFSTVSITFICALWRSIRLICVRGSHPERKEKNRTYIYGESDIYIYVYARRSKIKLPLSRSIIIPVSGNFIGERDTKTSGGEEWHAR